MCLTNMPIHSSLNRPVTISAKKATISNAANFPMSVSGRASPKISVVVLKKLIHMLVSSYSGKANYKDVMLVKTAGPLEVSYVISVKF